MTDLAEETEILAPPDAIEQDVRTLMFIVAWQHEHSPAREALARLAIFARSNGIEAYDVMLQAQRKAKAKTGRKIDPDEENEGE